MVHSLQECKDFFLKVHVTQFRKHLGHVTGVLTRVLEQRLRIGVESPFQSSPCMRPERCTQEVWRQLLHQGEESGASPSILKVT